MLNKLKHALKNCVRGKSGNCWNRCVDLCYAYFTNVHYSAGNMKQLVN